MCFISLHQTRKLSIIHLRIVQLTIVVDVMSTFESEYEHDGPIARQIAAVIPYYPFHGVDRFYDISGMTHNPHVFQLCIDVFVRRYANMNVDAVAGLDARGFVLGPPIALALKKPFIMVRKQGKLPNAVSGLEYRKEYVGDNASGGDELCVSRTAIIPGARVLVIDDLVATGVRYEQLLSVTVGLCDNVSLHTIKPCREP